MTDIMTQDDTEPRLNFSFYLCPRLTSPNYAFMRRRLYSKRKVKEYTNRIKLYKYEYSIETALILSTFNTPLDYFAVWQKHDNKQQCAINNSNGDSNHFN